MPSFEIFHEHITREEIPSFENFHKHLTREQMPSFEIFYEHLTREQSNLALRINFLWLKPPKLSTKPNIRKINILLKLVSLPPSLNAKQKLLLHLSSLMGLPPRKLIRSHIKPIVLWHPRACCM